MYAYQRSTMEAAALSRYASWVRPICYANHLADYVPIWYINLAITGKQRLFAIDWNTVPHFRETKRCNLGQIHRRTSAMRVPVLCYSTRRVLGTASVWGALGLCKDYIYVLDGIRNGRSAPVGQANMPTQALSSIGLAGILRDHCTPPYFSPRCC